MCDELDARIWVAGHGRFSRDVDAALGRLCGFLPDRLRLGANPKGNQLRATTMITIPRRQGA